jgi:hypothetical protein
MVKDYVKDTRNVTQDQLVHLEKIAQQGKLGDIWGFNFGDPIDF